MCAPSARCSAPPCVLEGTVRKAGDRLRITAQLTSTEDGRLLWSQRYDRQLDDVFAIQEEIGRTIVDTLRATSFADLNAPTPEARDPEREGLRPVPQGTLRLEQAHAGRRRGRHRLLRAGDRRRSDVRAGVHRTRPIPTRCRSTTAASRSPRDSRARKSRRGGPWSWTRPWRRRTRRSPGASSSMIGTGMPPTGNSGAPSSSTHATPRRGSGTRSCW